MHLEKRRVEAILVRVFEFRGAGPKSSGGMAEVVPHDSLVQNKVERVDPEIRKPHKKRISGF